MNPAPDLGSALRVLATLSFGDWLALASAIVAAGSYLMGRATVRRQELLQVESLRAQEDADLIAWADTAIDAIADAQRHCRDLKNGLLEGVEALRNGSAVRTRLSALLDRGRLFFPNAGESGEAEEAEAAYAGSSHPAIKALYGCYRIVSDLGRPGGLAPDEAVRGVVAHRRRFVSEVYVTVDPRRRQAAIRALAAAAGKPR